MERGMTTPQQAKFAIADVRAKMLKKVETCWESFGTEQTARTAMLMAVSQIEQNGRLLEACQTPGGIASLFGAIVKAGCYGWLCDGIMGHAALVPFKTNVAKRGEPAKHEMRVQLIPGYKGLRQLVDNTGKCVLALEVVYDCDTFEFCDPFSLPKHIRGTAANRKLQKVTGAYVLAKFTTGLMRTWYMSREECIAHRDAHSQNWRNAKQYGGANKDNPWHEDSPHFGVMCCKTVLLQAIHRGDLPMSIQDRTLALTEISTDASRNSSDSTSGMVLDGEVSAMALPAPEPEEAAQPAQESTQTAEADQSVDLEADAAKQLKLCKTPQQVDDCVRAWLEEEGIDIRDLGELKKQALLTVSNRRKR